MCLLNLRRYNVNYNKIKLYICRYKKNNCYGLARPCSACIEMIKQYNISNIIYSIDNGYMYEYIK